MVVMAAMLVLMEVLVVVMVAVEGRDQLCLPGLTPFLQDYITRYSYSEVHLIFNGSADGQLVVTGRQMLARSLALTSAFINVAGDPRALRKVASMFNTPQHDKPLHVSSTGHQHVQNYRKPLFLAMLSTAIALNDEKKVEVWEKSRWGTWLLLGEDLRPLLSPDQYLPLDNKVTVATWGRDGGVELWEAYQAAPSLPHRVSKVGVWLFPATLNYNETCPGGNVSQPAEGKGEKEGQYSTDISSASTSFPSEGRAARRRNLTGLHLRCLTESWEPSTQNTLVEGQEGLFNVGGHIGEMFSLLADTLNFTYECRQAPDREFGSLEDGKWTGLVGELVAGRGDIIVTALDKTYQRSQIIDYTYPYGDIEYVMVIRTPEPHMWTKYTVQLEVRSWLTYFAFLLVTPLVYYLLSAYSPLLEPVSLQEAWFTVFSLTLNQGNMEVSGHARRLLQMTVVATSWLIIAFYTSVLVSSLAVPILAPPFTDAAGLLRASTHNLGLQKGNSEVERLKTSKNRILQQIWSRLVATDSSNLVDGIEQGLWKVKEENFVFLVEKNYFSHHMGGNCSFYQLQETLFRSSTGVALKKDSPLLLVFNNEIFNQHVAGLVDRSRTRFSAIHSSCETDTTGPINLRTIFTAFFILAVVMPIALLILLLEIYIYRHYKETRRTEGQVTVATEGNLRSYPIGK